MNEKRFTSFHMIAIAVGSVLVTLCGVALAAWLFLGSGGLTMLQGLHLIEDRFVGGAAEEQVLDGAMSGMVSALGDRWSYYATPEQFAAQNLRRTNHYVGIGVTVTYEREEGLLVQSVTEGGTAQESGILPGDVILSADGFSLAGEGKTEGAAKIQGEEGTSVTLELLSPDGTKRTVTLLRRSMEVEAVTYEKLESGLGYIKVANFYERTAESVEKAVADLQKQGVTGLIFDMRNNPGGYLGELTKMLDYLLPEGPIFASHSKNGPTQTTQSDAACVDLPMAVLVNQDTYSAAEFFAAQLRESVSAPVIGTTTCGKGYSQQSFPLKNGGALAISTGAYTTGKGVSLVGTGLIPDRELPLSETEDNQLAAAVDALHK
ncbi:MAG: S41 family peptidase [Oscillospiraceae bacterium]